MTVVDFDEQVARDNGYHVVTHENGDRQSVPIDPSSSLKPSTVLPGTTGGASTSAYDYDQVRGNCGVSWIAMRDAGFGKVQVSSSLTQLPARALSYSWNVSYNDARDTRALRKGGVANRKSWAWNWWIDDKAGYAFRAHIVRSYGAFRR